MTGFHRLSIFAIAALVAAGCGATTPTSVPGESLAASAEPSSVAAASDPAPAPTYRVIQTYPPGEPSPAATPEPSKDPCPSRVPDDQPSVWLSTDLARGQPVVDITRMARVSDPETALPLPHPDRPPSNVGFIGGREAYLGLYYIDFDWPWGWNIQRLSAKLTMDGHEPIELVVDLGRDSLGNLSGGRVNVPDMDATGVLDVQVDWYDTCFIYEGTVTTPVRIYPASSVAGCPTKRGAGFDELYATFEPPAFINGVGVDFVFWLWAGKIRDLYAADPLPPYVGFDRNTPTFEVGPRATMTVSIPNPALELSLHEGWKVIFFERAPLLRWLEDGWIHGNEPEAPIVFRSKLVANPNGTYSFETPPDPGRYAAQVAFDYDSACTLGTAGLVVGIDVQ